MCSYLDVTPPRTGPVNDGEAHKKGAASRGEGGITAPEGAPRGGQGITAPTDCTTHGPPAGSDQTPSDVASNPVASTGLFGSAWRLVLIPVTKRVRLPPVP
jgi:hypothetical protein